MDDGVKLTDLISAETLQRIQDAFSAMTGMAALTTDANGRPVTKGSNFSQFCMKYVRESEDGHIRCEQCDRFGAEDSWSSGSSCYYYCHAGLIDYAAPILAGKEMIGSFIGGQVLTSPPDRERIYEIAWELGINPAKLWEAALRIPIIDEQRIEDAAQFLFTVANVLSDMAYGKYRMLLANQEIERVGRMKSDFLANMSHEIRTPMNAVVGMAEMALREELSPTVREYLRQIKSSSRALLTIINDILDFSKIESGKMDIIPVEYEAMSIVNDVANIAVERLKDKDVELILDISPDIPHMLCGDNIRIKQILLNFVNNAVKFTQEGQVLVRMSQMPLTTGKIMLRFDIEDTGIGIKKNDLDKIFESFQQVDSKRNRNIEGTGLGLAISRQLTQLMGGNIQVESQYGKGSSFSFEIPQEVADDKPSCSLPWPDGIKAFCLLENSYVSRNFMQDCERLHVECEQLEDIGQLECPEGKIAFLFVEQEKFTESVREKIESMPELTAVLLYPFRAEPADYKIPNLLMMRKPLYILNEVNVFSGEGTISSFSEEDTVDFDFIAPAAKVLVVDDNPTNLIVTEGLLEPLHMIIDKASGGREAIEMITAEHYDLIFMDHMMPDMDGVETTQVIRRDHPDYDNVPIIALTANAMSGTRELFLKEGMNDFVSKPIELRSLLKKVALWLPKEKIEKADGAGNAYMQDVPADLKIGDLETSVAMQLIGNEKLYRSVLKEYYKMIGQKSEAIRKYQKERDFKAYTIEVHSLKSTSRQIGAMKLSDMAAALEKAGNEADGGYIDANTEAMLEKYLSYQSVLAPFCEEEKAASVRGRITKEALFGYFEEMEAAMEELDMDRMEEVCAAMKEYSYEEGQRDCFENLIHAADNIDVDECEEIIKAWKELLL